MSEAERIIVILSPSYLTTTDSFVQYQRRLVQQAASRILVVQVGNCGPCLSKEFKFYSDAPMLDFMPIVGAEDTFCQCLIERIRQIG